MGRIPDGVDVLVTHGPRHRVLDDVAGYRAAVDLFDDDDEARSVGCVDLRERVKAVKPRVHVFGRIDSQRGRVVADGTEFYHCTTNECDLPCTVIDLEKR